MCNVTQVVTQLLQQRSGFVKRMPWFQCIEWIDVERYHFYIHVNGLSMTMVIRNYSLRKLRHCKICIIWLGEILVLINWIGYFLFHRFQSFGKIQCLYLTTIGFWKIQCLYLTTIGFGKIQCLYLTTIGLGKPMLCYTNTPDFPWQTWIIIWPDLCQVIHTHVT